MFLFCVFIIQVAMNLAPNQPDSLTITIENIGTSAGVLRICLFENEADFIQSPTMCEVVSDFSLPYHIQVIQIPLDREFAVIVYHDLNGNGRLDRNFLGIPREPYGFSNNPSTRFGPPRFLEAKFDVSLNNSITIRL